MKPKKSKTYSDFNSNFLRIKALRENQEIGSLFLFTYKFPQLCKLQKMKF